MLSSLLFRVSRPALKKIFPNKICKNALLAPSVCVGIDTNTNCFSSSSAVNTFQPPHTVLENSDNNNIPANEVAAHTEDTAENEESSAELKEIAEEDTNADIIKSSSAESSKVAEDIQSKDNPHEGIPPEEVLRKGRFSWIE